MSTDITVSTFTYGVERRSWMIDEHGSDETPSVTLDLALFPTQDDIPSGTPLGIVTATGLAGPYDAAATDGREKCYGLLFSTVRDGRSSGKVGSAVLVHGFVSLSKLPVALDEAGQDALRLIHFSA